MSEALRRALAGPHGPHVEDAQMAAYLDQALPSAEREAVERHLAGCDACAADLVAVSQVLVEAEAVAEVDRPKPQAITPGPTPARASSSRKTWFRLAASIALILGGLLLTREAGRLVASRLEPVIVAQLEDWSGRDVSLGSTALKLAGGPGVELRDFRWGDDPRYSDQDFVTASRVALHVQPGELLGGRLSGSLDLERPVLRLVRDRAGHWNVETLGGREPGPAGEQHGVRAELEQALADAAAGIDPEIAGAEARVQLSSATITDGILEIRDLGRSGGTLKMEDVDLEYHGAPGQRGAVALEGRFGTEEDRIALQGEVGPFDGDATPVYRLREVEVNAVPVSEIPGAPAAVAGRLDFEGHLDSAGRSLGEIVAAARGAGEIGLCCGQLAGRNVARDLVDELAHQPEAGALLAALRESASLRGALAANHTMFDQLAGLADLEPGTLHVAGLEANTPLFRLDGDASIGLEGALAAEGIIDLAPALSRAVVAAAPALANLQVADGSLSLPVRAEGTWEQLELQLDVEAVARSLGLDAPPNLFALLGPTTDSLGSS